MGAGLGAKTKEIFIPFNEPDLRKNKALFYSGAGVVVGARGGYIKSANI